MKDVLVVGKDARSEDLIGKKALIVKEDVDFSHILALSLKLDIPSMYAVGEAAVLMGLEYDPKRNFEDSKAKGIRVFDGCNGQRFLIDSNWETDKIYEELGKALILMGKRQKAMEVSRVLSVNSD